MEKRIINILTSSLILLTISANGSQGAANSFTEDFTTTASKDPVNTTADWNTTDGELKLFPFELTLSGTYDTPGGGNDVFIAGNYAYVADGGEGLQVIDISDPTAPLLVGTFDTAGGAADVVVSGNVAYVAGGSGGLYAICKTLIIQP